jgi:hypothetical protein
VPQILDVCSQSGLVADGDSLNYGVAEISLASLQHVDFLAAEIGGTDCQQATDTYDLYAAHLYDAHRTRNAVALGCGHNSYIHGYTTDQTYAQILAYFAKARATGYSELNLWTVLPSIEVDTTWRHTLNTLIINGAATNGYTVIDVASDPTIGCDLCWQNTTYYDSGVHLTPAGKTIQASYLTPVLQAGGFQ